MNDQQKFRKLSLIILILVLLIVENWSVISVSIGERRSITQLQNVEYNKQQQQQYRLENQGIPHRSYDSNDDVAGIGSVDVYDVYNNRDCDDDGDKSDHADNNEHQQLSLQSLHVRQRRELSDWLLVPNTRWCGRGNSANNTYNHLGGASGADKCCRKHDHCLYFINSMTNRYELFNYRPYTLSHCNCDRRFRTCLKMSNDDDAKTIGKFFFNVIQMQCFILKTERTCLKRSTNGNCERERVKKKAYLRNNKRF